MLLELRIRNLAIIDELDITFSDGFNVLTGETGAGKSIILSALQLLLGDRVTEDIIRSSEEEVSIEALFDIRGNEKVRQILRERYPKKGGGEDDSLLIKRLITRGGRGRVLVNGNLSTLGMLGEIGSELVSIYGQHEHQKLQRVDIHIDILDEFGGLLDLRSRFRDRFGLYNSCRDELKRLREEKERRSRDRELMVFQSQEIEAARLRPGEEDDLREEKIFLSNAEKLAGFANLVSALLWGEGGSAIGMLQEILRKGREIELIDPKFSSFLKEVESLKIQMEELCLWVRDYAAKIESNPQRLEEVENRLAEIDRLKRKYGPTIDEILRFKQKVDEALRLHDTEDERILELERKLDPLLHEVEALAEELSSCRKRASLELERLVEKELSSLGMKRTTFEVRLERVPLNPDGVDRVEFLISPNIGEEVRPLAKIASGGELSRIMLALKRILAKVGGREVLVFDEVDSGIGGAVAEVVGKKLKELSRHHQVICVTHLPQIACFADTHHQVRKQIKGGRTITQVVPLHGDAVVEEIARMMGGLKVTEKTRAHAREMIENARRL